MTTDTRICQWNLVYTENEKIIDYLQNHKTVAPTVDDECLEIIYLMKQDYSDSTLLTVKQQ